MLILVYYYMTPHPSKVINILGGIPMESIHITSEQLMKFAKLVGKERSTRLRAWIEENTPALYKAFSSENGLPVDTDARPMNATHHDQQRAAKAAVALEIIQNLQKYIDGLNVPDDQINTRHDHGHGGCKCGGHCNCGGHGGCNCGGDGHDTNK